MTKAGKITGQNIYLSQRANIRTVAGIVLWPDGKPAVNATVMLSYPDYQWHQDPVHQPDSEGKFSLQIPTDCKTTLWVQAQNTSGVWMNAGQIELPAEGPISTQTLYLSHEPVKWKPRQ